MIAMSGSKVVESTTALNLVKIQPTSISILFCTTVLLHTPTVVDVMVLSMQQQGCSTTHW